MRPARANRLPRTRAARSRDRARDRCGSCTDGRVNLTRRSRANAAAIAIARVVPPTARHAPGPTYVDRARAAASPHDYEGVASGQLLRAAVTGPDREWSYHAIARVSSWRASSGRATSTTRREYQCPRSVTTMAAWDCATSQKVH